MMFGSLFAGIGGMDLGLERAGLSCAWQVEINPFARQILAKHWPDVPRFEDVRDVGATELAQVDMIAGGFPCQDISNAHTNGKRAALEGEKSGLWREYARIIDALEPDWVVVENVAAIERWLPTVRGDLWCLGYASLPVELDTARFGARHPRKRVFVLAHPNRDSESLRKVYAEMASLSTIPGCGWNRWRPPPSHLGSDARVPGRMDRLRALGNSVAPGMTELIGTAISRVSLQKLQNDYEWVITS